MSELKVTPEVFKKIKELYKTMPLTEISKIVGISITSISKHLRKHGVPRSNRRRSNYLVDQVLQAHAEKPTWQILKILANKGIHRSKHTIDPWRKKLGLTRKDTANGYAGSELADLLGTAHGNVWRWHKNGLLKATVISSPDSQLKLLQITPKQVREFIINNPAKIDLSKVDKYWFIDLLGGSDNRIAHIQHTCGKGDNSGLSEMQLLN